MSTADDAKAPLKRYLRIPTIQKMFDGASRKYIEGLINEGKLRAYKPSYKMTLILYEDVIALLEANKVEPRTQSQTA